MKFINLEDTFNRWGLDKVYEITSKVMEYVNKRKMKDVELFSVEDNTWEDEKNQRYDICIRYSKNGTLFEQHLLMLKGEVLDGKTFHKRFHEFY